VSVTDTTKQPDAIDDWTADSDVLVLGSGSAGLSAAVAAQSTGANVTLLERSLKIGGTSAVSGGVSWIPNNHHMKEVGAADSRDRALTYLKLLASERSDAGMLETYVDRAPEVLHFLERETELRFRALRWCDYRPEFPGGNFGRSLSPALFPKVGLGELGELLRPSATFPVPFTMSDLEDGLNVLDEKLIGERMMKGLVGTGNALIAGLLKAFIDRGGILQRGTRGRKLVIADGAVVGVETERDNRRLNFRARCGVVLACGGYEWNEQLCRDLLQGALEGPASPPGNEGDGLLMAMEAGAATANLDKAWWMPTMRVPHEQYDGRPLSRLATAELTKPGSIMVNRHGKRFVNEACNYNDLGRSFFAFDASHYEYPNRQAWIILHRPYLDRYPFLTRYPGDPIPSWLIQADCLRALAREIGVDGEALAQTVSEFNRHALKGLDPFLGEARVNMIATTVTLFTRAHFVHSGRSTRVRSSPAAFTPVLSVLKEGQKSINELRSWGSMGPPFRVSTRQVTSRPI
jgi:3-oxosteroid 1-dehydrogenase